MDRHTFLDVDDALMWWFRVAMDTARDPGRPAKSRLSLLMNGCEAWRQVMEHRTDYRATDRRTTDVLATNPMRVKHYITVDVAYTNTGDIARIATYGLSDVPDQALSHVASQITGYLSGDQQTKEQQS